VAHDEGAEKTRPEVGDLEFKANNDDVNDVAHDQNDSVVRCFPVLVEVLLLDVPQGKQKELLEKGFRKGCQRGFWVGRGGWEAYEEEEGVVGNDAKEGKGGGNRHEAHPHLGHVVGPVRPRCCRDDAVEEGGEPEDHERQRHGHAKVFHHPLRIHNEKQPREAEEENRGVEVDPNHQLKPD